MVRTPFEKTKGRSQSPGLENLKPLPDNQTRLSPGRKSPLQTSNII